MAPLSDAKIVPHDDYPKCDFCGWTDRKLRIVGTNLTPEDRIAVHKWARHGHPLPEAWHNVSRSG